MLCKYQLFFSLWHVDFVEIPKEVRIIFEKTFSIFTFFMFVQPLGIREINFFIKSDLIVNTTISSRH